ncbi:MAG TPA: hypothetical protein VG245_06830 [Candidatus Dormibacteraeota bacterium]|nr:hypothetical protein [Candidatus Dormibacteraeota bacterium]
MFDRRILAAVAAILAAVSSVPRTALAAGTDVQHGHLVFESVGTLSGTGGTMYGLSVPFSLSGVHVDAGGGATPFAIAADYGGAYFDFSSATIAGVSTSCGVSSLGGEYDGFFITAELEAAQGTYGTTTINGVILKMRISGVMVAASAQGPETLHLVAGGISAGLYHDGYIVTTITAPLGAGSAAMAVTDVNVHPGDLCGTQTVNATMAGAIDWA